MATTVGGKFEAALARIDAAIWKLRQPYSPPLDAPWFPTCHPQIPIKEVTNPHLTSTSLIGTPVKRKFPKFPFFKEGDPRKWICEIEEYFDFYEIPGRHKISESQKLNCATLHLRGRASQWFHRHIKPQIHELSWSLFLEKLIDQFDSTELEDSNKLMVVDEVNAIDVVSCEKNRDGVVFDSLENLEMENYRSDKSSKVFDELENQGKEKLIDQFGILEIEIDDAYLGRKIHEDVVVEDCDVVEGENQKDDETNLVDDYEEKFRTFSIVSEENEEKLMFAKKVSKMSSSSVCGNVSNTIFPYLELRLSFRRNVKRAEFEVHTVVIGSDMVVLDGWPPPTCGKKVRRFLQAVERSGGMVETSAGNMRVSTGRYHTLLIHDSSIYSCGSSLCGVLGHVQDTTQCSSFTRISFSPLFRVVQMSASHNHAAFVMQSGEVFTCEDNSSFCCGHGEVLEAKIGNWIQFVRTAVKLLFAAERKICDQIFEGINNVLEDQCFAEVTSNSLLMLLSFGDAIAKSKRSSEKLFVLLDRYEIMRELQPEIVTIFDGRACPEMREASLGLTKRLAQTAQETFGDFVEAVEKDATKTAVQDGTVHPLTSYVILYILLCGVPPFWAESELGVAQAILRGFVDFKHEPWPSVSVSAKNLVKQMLEPDPKLRLTAKQVLEHPWLHNAKMAPNVPLVDAVKSRLKQFSVMNRFKRRALRVIADHLSIDEVEDIKEIFKKIDKDNDGSVSCTELKTGLTKHGSHLAESEVRMLIEAVVTSGKGTLDYAESLGISLHLLKMAKEEHLRRTFSYFDKDGNGYIEAEELQEALAEDGAADSRGAANDVLQEVDTDKDGRISYEEIVAMMKTGTDEASNGVLVQC